MTGTATAGMEPFHGLEINALARRLEADGRDIAFLEQGQPAAPPAPRVIEAVRAVLDSVSRETGTRFDMRPLQQTAGGQIVGADTSKLVRASVSIAKALGMMPQLGHAGSSNLNVAIAGGTLAIGMGGERGGARAEPGEFADIPSMMRSAKFVARLAAVMGMR